MKLLAFIVSPRTSALRHQHVRGAVGRVEPETDAPVFHREAITKVALGAAGGNVAVLLQSLANEFLFNLVHI